MDFAEQLAAELTDLRQKVGKAEHMDDFTTHYERLLHLLVATQRTMRDLAFEQGRWLCRQAGEQGRMN